MRSRIGVGIVGFGTVGTGVAKILLDNAAPAIGLLIRPLVPFDDTGAFNFDLALQRRHFQHAQFGGDPQPPQLRDDQPFAIGIEEHPLHGTVGPVMINADASRFVRVGIGRHANQPIDEIGGLGRDLQGVPAQAIRRDVTQRTTRQLSAELGKHRMMSRWPDAVHPGPARFAAGTLVVDPLTAKRLQLNAGDQVRAVALSAARESK